MSFRTVPELTVNGLVVELTFTFVDIFGRGSAPWSVIVKWQTFLAVLSIGEMFTFAHSCPFAIQTCGSEEISLDYFFGCGGNLNRSYLCWQHTCSRDRYICILRQLLHRQWHRSTISIPPDRRTLRHRRCSDDSTKCEYPSPLPNSAQKINWNWFRNGSRDWHRFFYILAIRRYSRNCMHSDVLPAMKRPHCHRATVRCHCIRWCTLPVFRLRLFSPTENRAIRTFHDTMHWRQEWNSHLRVLGQWIRKFRSYL